jgi:hypothetical protein
MKKILPLIAFIVFFSHSVISQKKYVVLSNGEVITERFKIGFCWGQNCRKARVIVYSNGVKTEYKEEQLDSYYTKKRAYIVRHYPQLFDSYAPYRLLLDGEVKVFDADLSDEQHIACVELEKNTFFPVTEKLFFKYILPFLNKKTLFKEWYEKTNPVYPSSKNDRLGGKNQNKVNKFIINVVSMYNGFGKG